MTGLIDRPPDPFPPEPVRFLGAQLVREAVIRKERSELAGREPRQAWRCGWPRSRPPGSRTRADGTAYGRTRYGNSADGTAPRRP